VSRETPIDAFCAEEADEVSIRSGALSVPIAPQRIEAVAGSAMTQNCIPTRAVGKILSLNLTFKLRGISLLGSVVRVSPMRISDSHWRET
jgi:hypothetical protein